MEVLEWMQVQEDVDADIEMNGADAATGLDERVDLAAWISPNPPCTLFFFFQSDPP